MKTKWENVFIPNTRRDIEEIITTISEVTDEGIKEVKKDLSYYDDEVNSLSDIYLGKSYSIDLNDNKVEVGDSYRLSDYISKIPHGIVDKKRPGIGATTIEINSFRNSIIVLPTKILAYNKYLQHPHTLYVGSKINEDRKTVGKNEIVTYLNNKKIGFKKFLVVADSLKDLLSTINTVDKNLYNNYFLMIDEVDMLQSDSNYRPRLEIVMDYYFLFPPKNRCLLTATMKEFSNPSLENEARFDLTAFKTKRNIHLIHTDNINKILLKEILKNTGDSKIVIAYNSIQQIQSIIFSLEPELQSKCAILCSSASEREAGIYYSTLQNNKLPKEIVFITSSYFSGIDIEEKFHLITVSNAEKFFQILSIDKMTQIAGRCRIENGLLSETIIYNTPRKNALRNDGGFQKTLLNTAQKVLDLYKAADAISENESDLINMFQVVKKAIQNKAVYSIGGEEIPLTRLHTVKKEYAPAYFNIDSIVEKMILNSGYYKYPNVLKEELSRLHNIVSYRTVKEKITKEQEAAETKSAEKYKHNFEIDILKAIEKINELEALGKLNDTELNKCILYSKRSERDFLRRFILLYKYLDKETLIEKLWEIRAKNRKAYKCVNNAVIYWALDDNHPVKADISTCLQINRIYSSNELDEILRPIIQYHFFKTLRQRVSINFLSSFYKIKRVKVPLTSSDKPKHLINQHKITGINPMGFSKHSMRISKDENLIGLLLL